MYLWTKWALGTNSEARPFFGQKWRIKLENGQIWVKKKVFESTKSGCEKQSFVKVPFRKKLKPFFQMILLFSPIQDFAHFCIFVPFALGFGRFKKKNAVFKNRQFSTEISKKFFFFFFFVFFWKNFRKFRSMTVGAKKKKKSELARRKKSKKKKNFWTFYKNPQKSARHGTPPCIPIFRGVL